MIPVVSFTHLLNRHALRQPPRLGDSGAGQARRSPPAVSPCRLCEHREQAGKGGKPWVTEPLSSVQPCSRGEAPAQGIGRTFQPTHASARGAAGRDHPEGSASFLWLHGNHQSPPSSQDSTRPQPLQASAGPEPGRAVRGRSGAPSGCWQSLSPGTRIPGSWFFKAHKERDRSKASAKASHTCKGTACPREGPLWTRRMEGAGHLGL